MNKIANEVKKPVEAIQCANHFSLLQRKIYNVLLANAAGNLRPDVTHRIPIGVLCKLSGYQSRDYDTVKKRFRELRRMDIEWDIINERGNKVWTNTSPLSLARVIEGEGICEYEFTKSLLPYLDRPAQYAKFSLAIQSKFKSSYGLALYENCERYRNIGHTKTFDIPTFRKLMGVKDQEYIDFFALKRRVIDQAVKEVNRIADFTIVPDYEKSGKRTVSIKFCFVVKKQKITEKCLEQKINDNPALLINKLKNLFFISEKDIATILDKYEANYIEEKINYVVSSRPFNNGTIDNVGAYLVSALAKDYKLRTSSKEIIAQIKRNALIAQQQQDEIEKESCDRNNKYNKYVRNAILKIVVQLNNETKNQFKTAFEEFLLKADPIAYRFYQKKAFASGFVYRYVEQYIKENYSSYLGDIISYDDFVETHLAQDRGANIIASE